MVSTILCFIRILHPRYCIQSALPVSSMAANGVKREDVKAEDETEVKLEADENKDSVKAEAGAAVKAEAAELEQQDVKNGRVKDEEKLKKHEMQQVEVAPVPGDAKRGVRSLKRDVKKDEESKEQDAEQEDRSHIRRKAVLCESALWDSIEWVLAAGAEVDAGQRLGTAGRLEEGNQRLLQAPCKGRLYILTKDQSDELLGDKKGAGAVMRTVAFVEYCIHPLRNGRTCLMCLAVVDDDEENEDMESVNVVSHGQHVVKLRPGLTEFLNELSALYDLFIYTHGTRLYAEQIVKIIDPDETYFKNRIVARTDTPDMLHKSLKLLFPSCDDSMILVLDDRIDVWKENEGNVFLIEPYHYFKCTSEINNASGRGVAGLEDTESEANDDNHLAQSTTVLKAKKIPGVLIVTPDWILKCARSWSRVPEDEFLADEWKARHTRQEAEKQQADASELPRAEVPDKTLTDPDADIGNNQPPQTSLSASPATEGKTVTSILLKREAGDAKRGKQVTFAKVIDDSGNPPSEDGAIQKSKVVRRSRVVRRLSGASRARTFTVGTVATGVVATGGTFDFLSKIKATKREPPRASVKTKKAEEAKKTPTRSASPPKDVDDAFLRLIEAEERENEEEEKRKRSSTDIKDQLSSRRVKKDNTKRSHDSDTAGTVGGKRMRVEQNDAAENDEEEEEEVGFSIEDVVSCHFF
ncbi:unnamed protein product [Phytophthora lilii]|uniref:protein-serine/threonine phosphatase n=1 Tax=Phytophthora lilii TaxID=2077276 RepID=A0A9W6UDP4_9STRA|nr:unnamed protein product [Phytophthora lilii]